MQDVHKGVMGNLQTTLWQPKLCQAPLFLPWDVECATKHHGGQPLRGIYPEKRVFFVTLSWNQYVSVPRIGHVLQYHFTVLNTSAPGF